MNRLLAPFAALIALSAPAGAQSVGDFYRGRQIKFIASYAPGTDCDVWARPIARHYPKHLPGKPTMIVQNMAGAGGMTGANHLANLAERDGATIMMIGRNLPYQALTKDPGVRFDPTTFNWIGSPEVANRVCGIMDAAPVKRAEDLFTTEALVGGNGAGSAVSGTPNLLARLLGMKFKVIEGYPAPSDIVLAMERGEVHGFCSSYLAMRQKPGWIESGRLKILFNMEHDPIPETRAPTIYQFAKTDEQRRILSIFNSSVELGRPIAAPPGVPADRVTSLRAGFEAAMKDPELVAEAGKQQLEINVVSGAKVQELIESLLASPPDLIEKVNSLSK